MSESFNPNSSQLQLVPPNNKDGSFVNNLFIRDPSGISTNDIQYPKLLENDSEVKEQTVMQVEIVNDNLLRKAHRSELASKSTCLTRRWQTALAIGLIILGLGIGIGSIAYWISLRTALTEPFLLYGAACYMDSRSCDATRMLWCPNGTCLCTGDFQWNVTAQNCTCGEYEIWDGFKCESYGSYGDPCNSIPCLPTLTCATVVNQTYTTGQDICVCDNVTYLYTGGGVNQGQCVPRLTYNQSCLTNFDCQNWLGLACAASSSGTTCLCQSTSYWNGFTCEENALGWQPCNTTVPCDTTRGLSCVSNICQCGQYDYWDNVTTFWCEQKKTYSVTCQYDFQCNTTVNLSCPSISTGCNCPDTSYPLMCDCQAGEFWDGQRCGNQHVFNGTCPGQYACSSNLVCYLGHCICPGNMVWGTPTPNICQCPGVTTWSTTLHTCI